MKQPAAWCDMMSQLVAGNALGRYELLLPIAKGGMAQVWAARLRGTRGFQKLVAIKTILSGAIDNTRLEQMFLAEAQLASQIHHPNVVDTLELGEHEGVLYLVMEWVDGEPVSYVLSQANQHGGLPLAIAVSLIAQACHGLHAAHELRDDNGNLLGVVHRDVSPQNLLVTLNGTAKLVDFGVAKATARAANLTEVGEIKGKFSYMAPEQVQGQVVDRRADIFALGILAYLLTTGKHPFRGANPGETVRNIMSAHAPPAPTSFVADYPAALEAVIMRALEKAPERRFATAEEMYDALKSALPAALETGFQAHVAAFLRKLLGARAEERRAAIKQAQEVADRQRADNGPSSIGTLRAISLDSLSDAMLSTPAGTTAVGGDSRSVSNPFASKPSSKRYVAAAIGAVAVCAAALALRGPGLIASSTVAASAGPVEPITVVRPAAAPAAVSAAAPRASEPVEVSELELEPTKRTKRERAPVFRRPATGAATTAPGAPSATGAAVVTPPASPSVKPAASINAWDRQAFGGRH